MAYRVRDPDIDGDGEVGPGDLEILRQVYGLTADQGGFNPQADLNMDGRIDIVDLAILAANYLRSE